MAAVLVAPAASDVAQPTQPWPLIDRALAVAIALPMALWTAAVLTASHAWLAQSVPDDAYYYFEIGQRLARGEGPTFDGVHATNGFHPLWQAIVGLLAIAFTGDLLVKAGLLLSIGFVAASAVLIVRALERRFGRRAALAGVAVALHATGMQLVVNGMETPVVLFAAVLVITLVDQRAPRRRPVIVGVACAALVLGRIDLVLAVWLVPLGLGWWRIPRTLARWCMGFSAVVVPVFVANLVAFRMPLTVSGSLKLHRAMDLAASSGGWLSAGYRAVVERALVDYGHAFSSAVATPAGSVPLPFPSTVQWLGAALVVVGGVFYVRSIRRGSAPRGLELVLSIFVIKTVLDLGVLPLWATGWYAGPFILLAGATAAAAAAERLLADRSSLVRRAWAVVLALLLALPAGVPRTGIDRVDPTAWQGGLADAAAWLRAHPVDGRIGAYDAGLLGFALDPWPVVNLDGLVNDPDYAQALIDGASPSQQMTMNAIDFIVGRFGDDDPRVPACAHDVWRSSSLVAYQDVATQPTYAPMRVIDVRCSR